MKAFSTKKVVFCGLIAALYVVLTWVLGEFSYGPLQFRISECLTVLPYLFPEATVGLTVGCLLANLFSPVGPLDLVFGTAATLLGAIGTQLCRKKKLFWLAPLPPVVANALLIGWMLTIYADEKHVFFLFAGQVGLSELLCCYALGLPLLLLLRQYLNNNKRGTSL